MSSLKDARDLALISHSQGLITDEELLLLLEENKSRNPEFSWCLRPLWFRKHGRSRVQIRVQSKEARYSSLSRSSWLAWDFHMSPEIRCWRYRGAMCGFKANKFLLPLQRYDLSLWPASSCFQSTLKPKLKVLKSFSSLRWIFPKLTIKKNSR